ncbi:Ankyrin repeat and KH domain-containing protein 1 [Hondaea fermentalgiana]|uniref:Ankyrin repeat and KH domain-containing protein 1 n=1 Tax=Hondaea fermentalgiana TaxID=2315210 RepID=A0A2R5G5C2_9STRA|nr:Ankyrin repeat and KH domain-containing protein 1 [Hondaea fermentalgiana]|eukprot:GBG26226.1 Ankyrin repeat and KH domain-containing protein 1 [Hondaea fermentalgiana]
MLEIIAADDLEAFMLKMQTSPFDLNAQSPAMNMMTILMLSIRDGSRNASIASYLTEFGADVNLSDSWGNTALYYACLKRRPILVEALLKRGADVNYENEYSGETALACASTIQAYRCAQILLENGARPRNDATAFLFMCMEENKLELTQLLVERGADLDVWGDDDITPLMLASASGMLDLIILFLESGANVDLQSETGTTALMYACQNLKSRHLKTVSAATGSDSNGHDAAVIECLLDHGASLKLRDSEGKSALEIACGIHGDPTIVQVLLDRGPVINPSKHPKGLNALMLACAAGQLEIVQLLLQYGANMDVQVGGDDDETKAVEGYTALMLACRLGEDEIAGLLLESGANVDLQGRDGNTALMFSCLFGQINLTRFQLQFGTALLNAQNQHGSTALMLACSLADGDDEPWEAMDEDNDFRQWRQRNTRGRNGVNVTRSVHQENTLQCVKLLWTLGSDAMLRDEKGDNAIDIARNNGRDDILAYFDFLHKTSVARFLLRKMRLSRELVTRFYDEDIRTLAKCFLLSEGDLLQLGITSYAEWQTELDKVLNELQAPQSALERRSLNRASNPRRLYEGYDSPPSRAEFDAFVVHYWGVNSTDHDSVSEVNTKLVQAGKLTWFDEERLIDNASYQLVNGAARSQKAVVFVTRRFMKEVNKRRADYCKQAFTVACHTFGPKRIIPVVLDADMLDSASWKGALQGWLLQENVIDFSTSSARERNFNCLIESLES